MKSSVILGIQRLRRCRKAFLLCLNRVGRTVLKNSNTPNGSSSYSDESLFVGLADGSAGSETTGAGSSGLGGIGLVLIRTASQRVSWNCSNTMTVRTVKGVASSSIRREISCRLPAYQMARKARSWRTENTGTRVLGGCSKGIAL